MRYVLVATTGHLLLVDLVQKKVRVLESDRTEYYGISWEPNGTELVLSHSGVNNANLTDLASYARSELGWISAGTRGSRRFLSAPHQILCAPDGRVVCTNTGRNVVTAIDLDKPGCYQEVGLNEVRWDRLGPEDLAGDHLNSVFIRDRQLFVVAHRFHKGALLATFSYPEMVLIKVEPMAGRTGLHNIWITAEGQRISCHSETGSLVDIDVTVPLWESGAPVYTRGLAAHGDHVLVGESQKSARDLRRSSMSGLWILDRQTWQALDYIPLGPYGAVNEVRLLDVADEAHHGVPYPGLERLLSEPDQHEQMTARRLAGARRVTSRRRSLANYEVVFGAFDTASDDALVAAPGNLCMLVSRVPLSGLSFDFQFTSADGAHDAHLSVIFGYEGKGGDTNMTALLLQPSGASTAALCLWRHDGVAWSRVSETLADGLPREGAILLDCTGDGAALQIDGKQVLRVGRATLGVANCTGGLGIRWTGASIGKLRNVAV